MAIKDEDFDMLAGGDDADEDAADSMSELEIENAEQEDSLNSPEEPGSDGQAAEEDGSQGETNEAKTGQQVPLATFLDERKAFQARLEEMGKKLENTTQQLSKFESLQERIERMQAEKAAAEEKENAPDYLDDPKAYVDHQVEQAKKTAEESKENITELRQMDQARQQLQQVNNRLSTYDVEFSKAHDDYYDALDHVRQINIQNGIDMGLAPAEAEQQAAQAIFVTQAQVMSKGINPSEYLYNMAKRWGFSQKGDPSPNQDSDDAILQGQNAQGMGGGVAPEPGNDEVDELTDEEFMDAFRETFGQDAR